MSERNLETFYESRVKLQERDPEQLGRGLPVGSIKDVTWVHQRYALTHGYNSVLELAIDELAAEINELKQRLDALETDLEQVGQIDAGG